MLKNLFLLNLLCLNFSFAVPPYSEKISFKLGKEASEVSFTAPGHLKNNLKHHVEYSQKHLKDRKFDYRINKLENLITHCDSGFISFFLTLFKKQEFFQAIWSHIASNYRPKDLKNLPLKKNNVLDSIGSIMKAIELKEVKSEDSIFGNMLVLFADIFEGYYEDKNDPFFSGFLKHVNLSEDSLPRLPYIVYNDHLDYMQSQILRDSFPEYELKLQELSDEAALKLSKSDEEYLKLKEENRRFVEKMKKERELLPKPESVLDERNPLGCAAGFDLQAPAAGAGGKTGASFDDKLLKELKDMEEKADSKVSGYSKLQPRKSEIASFYSFFLPAKYDAEKTDQFVSFFGIDSRKFYEMIEDVLEKNTKAKKKKASKIEDKIESFFGQSVFNKGSARHYKIALANKEYDLYLHKDHAGTQGWQTSANYALIYFLDALKSDFEKSLD